MITSWPECTTLCEREPKPSKSLRHVGDSRSQYLQPFANVLVFRGTKEALVENLVGYTMTEKVRLNTTSGAFEKIRVP